MARSVLAICALAALLALASALSFELEAGMKFLVPEECDECFFLGMCRSNTLHINPQILTGSTRILRHEFGKDTAVVGDYKVTDVPNQRVVVEIRDENGGLIKAGSVEGKLVFTTDVQGMYEFHFTSQIEPGMLDHGRPFPSVEQNDWA